MWKTIRRRLPELRRQVQQTLEEQQREAPLPAKIFLNYLLVMDDQVGDIPQEAWQWKSVTTILS